VIGQVQDPVSRLVEHRVRPPRATLQQSTVGHGQEQRRAILVDRHAQGGLLQKRIVAIVRVNRRFQKLLQGDRIPEQQHARVGGQRVLRPHKAPLLLLLLLLLLLVVVEVEILSFWEAS